MSGNAKFRFLLASFCIALFLFGCAGIPPTYSTPSPSEIIAENKERVRKNPNDTNAIFLLGYTYDRIGEYEKAIQPWKKLIQLKPDSHSPHYNLGYAYEKLGRIDEAIKEYTAGFKIAPEITKYFDSNLYDQVVKKYARTLPSGDDLEDAIDAYERKDYKTAYKLLLPLAEQGVASAQNNLGWMYAQGHGVPQDYKEAVKWYRLSVEQGYATAQVNLGFMYNFGRGVPQDYKEAVRLYRLSAEQGFM